MSKIRWSDAAIEDSSGMLRGGITEERKNGHAGRDVRQTIGSLVSVNDHRKSSKRKELPQDPLGKEAGLGFCTDSNSGACAQ